MNAPLVIGVSVLLPVFGALAVLLLRSNPNAREGATLVAGGLTFYHVLGLLHLVREGARPRLDLLEVAPGADSADLNKCRHVLFSSNLSGRSSQIEFCYIFCDFSRGFDRKGFVFFMVVEEERILPFGPDDFDVINPDKTEGVADLAGQRIAVVVFLVDAAGSHQ